MQAANQVNSERDAARLERLVEAARRQEEEEAAVVAEAVEGVEPLDLFGDVSLAGSPELPAACLPGVIDDFARDTAERLGVDRALIALPAITVTAATIDDRIQVQPREYDTTWRESARLWTAGIAGPGEVKTPALGAVMRPLRHIESGWYERDHAAATAYEIEYRVYSKQIDEYVRKTAKGETLRAPIEPQRPPVRRLIIDDVTVEAASEILVDNPRGILHFHDELAEWFASFDAYRNRGGKDRPQWIAAYDGGPKLIDRVKRGRVQVPNWSVCQLGGIQPGPMARLARKIDDDGLLQRFVVFFPAPAVEGKDRPPNERAIRAYHETIRRLVALTAPAEVIRLTPGAQTQRAIIEKLARSVMILPETSAAFRGHLAKWPGLFARLVLTFHAVDAASRHELLPLEITEDTAARVARLMADYLLPNAARFYSEILGQDHLIHARWIAGFILARHLEHISARDVGRAYRELRGQAERVAEVMGVLDLAGWVEVLDTIGRPPKRWRVNPRVHDTFRARAEVERHRREEIRHQIAETTRTLGVGEGAA